MGARLFIDIIMFALTVNIYVCTPVLVHKNQEVEITLLEENWISDRRVRRAADSNMPDRLAFTIPVKGQTAVLRMMRTKLLPVIMSSEETTRAANGFSENEAVYTDVSMRSAMIVKRDTQHYALKGSFVHNDVLWKLEHTKENGNEGKIGHRIAPEDASDTISYVGDDIIFTGDTTKVIDIKEEEIKQNNTEQRLNQVNHRRLKRETSQDVVKVAFVVDFADYSKWVKYIGLKDAAKEMRLWYTYVAHSMNVRYRTIEDPDVDIKIDVTILKILDTPKEATFLNKITNPEGQFNGEKGLSAFVSWHKRQRDIPASHHYMLFTGLDITGISGIAYMSRLCTDEGISIVQNSFDGNVGNTAAHELGHSLSAKHDEDTSRGSDCTYEDQFIMAPSFKKPVAAGKEGHPWRFSTCSIAAFKTFLRRNTCTREGKSGIDVLAAGESELRPGEVLGRDDQCGQYFQNDLSYFCEDTQELQGGTEKLCGGMYCSIPNSEEFCRTVIPQEFTDCGKDKWCVTGQCVDKYNNSSAATEARAPTSATETTSSSRRSASNYPQPSTTRPVPNGLRFPAVTPRNVDIPLPTTSTRLSLANCYMLLLLGDSPAFYQCKSSLEYQQYQHM